MYIKRGNIKTDLRCISRGMILSISQLSYNHNLRFIIPHGITGIPDVSILP